MAFDSSIELFDRVIEIVRGLAVREVQTLVEARNTVLLAHSTCDLLGGDVDNFIDRDVWTSGQTSLLQMHFHFVEVEDDHLFRATRAFLSLAESFDIDA